MSTSLRLVAGVGLSIALMTATEALGQAPKPEPKSVPGTGQPAFRQPYYSPYG
jgi:hypothetical protein